MPQYTAISPDGTMHGYTVTDPIPPELDGFPWPRDIAPLIAAADVAWEALSDAYDAYSDAVDEHERIAPAKDTEALRAALRAGDPDPGTPASDAAARARVVAWEQFKVAMEDQGRALAAGHSAVITYQREYAHELAAWELARLADAQAAQVVADQARSAAENAWGQVGGASRIMDDYTSTRGTDDAGRMRNTWHRGGSNSFASDAHNEELRARWEAAADGEPEPVRTLAQMHASELDMAAELGSTEARAELARRRAESRQVTA